MKLAKLGLVVVAAASAAWAQAKPAAPAAQKPAAKPAAPAAGTPSAAMPALKPAKPAAKAAPVMHSPMAPKKAVPAKKAAARPAAAKPAAAPEMARAGNEGRGKRDPFVSPIVRVSSGPTVACNTGKRCLVAGELMLRGIVKAQDGMIAVVENSSHRTYFLRENDPVYNGVVSKITGDSIVVRENTTDSVGRPMTREVVKKVAPTA